LPSRRNMLIVLVCFRPRLVWPDIYEVIKCGLFGAHGTAGKIMMPADPRGLFFNN